MNDERQWCIREIINERDPEKQLELAQKYSAEHPEDAEFKFFIGETLCFTAYNSRDETYSSSELEGAINVFESFKDELKYSPSALKYLEAIHYFLAENLGAERDKVEHYRQFGKLGHLSESLLSLCRMYIDKGRWGDAEKQVAGAVDAGVSEAAAKKVHLYLAGGHPELEVRAKHYSALGDPNSLLSVSLLCAKQNSWQNAEDFANRSIAAGLSAETTELIRAYLAEKMPTTEAKIRNYAALTGDPFALLAIALIHSEQKNWEQADSYATKSFEAGLPGDLSRPVRLYLAANLQGREGKIKYYRQLEGGANALLMLSFNAAKEERWKEAVAFLEAAGLNGAHEYIQIAKVMEAAKELPDISSFSNEEARKTILQIENTLFEDTKKRQEFFSPLPPEPKAYRLLAGIAGSRGYPEIQRWTLEESLSLSKRPVGEEAPVTTILKEDLILLYRKAARESKDNPEKEKCYQNLLQHSPTDLEANLELGRMNQRKGLLRQAAGYYSQVLANQPEHLEALVMVARNLFSFNNGIACFNYYKPVANLAEKERREREQKFQATQELPPEEKFALLTDEILAELPPAMRLWYYQTGDAAAFLLTCYKLRRREGYQKEAEEYLQKAVAERLHFHPKIAALCDLIIKMWQAEKNKINLTLPQARIKFFGYDPLTIPRETATQPVLTSILKELDDLSWRREK